MPITLRITPTITFDDIYGAHNYYSGVAPFVESIWTPNPKLADLRAAAQLTVVEDMPYICHASVATKRGLAIMDFANMPYANQLCVYDTAENYAQIIDTAVKSEASIVLKFVYPENTIPARRLWNSRTLTCALNNKKNLHLYVPEVNLPSRKCISVSQIDCQKLQFPVVVKAPVEWFTGSGSAISICHTYKDIDTTLQRFFECADLVFEEYLEIENSYCVQFATTPDGNMHYLGMAEQVTGPDGSFYGSWLEDPKNDPSQLADVGKFIMQVAMDLGYRGVAGFDIAICKDGRILVIDLNFRPNGSTAALLLYKSIAKSLHSPIIRYSNWKGTQGFNAFDRAVRKAIANGTFLPLSVYDPEHNCSQGDSPMISGVLAGATKEEVNIRMQELDKMGLIDQSS